jgi:hypothetical protein
MASLTVEGVVVQLDKEKTSGRGTTRQEGQLTLKDGRRVFVSVYPPKAAKDPESAPKAAKAPKLRRGGMDLGELVQALKQAGVIPAAGASAPQSEPSGEGEPSAA